MTVTIVSYGLLVSALAAAVAWLLERMQVAFARPRRFAWMAGIAATLLVPVLVVAVRAPGSGGAMPGNVTWIASALKATATLAGDQPARSSRPGWQIDGWLAVAWALATCSLIVVYGVSALRLRRRTRSWQAMELDEAAVLVAPDVGPAVFGWRPRMVFPRWLIQAPADVQRLALAHEREHLAAGDPQVLTLTSLLVALLPWNLPLHWMLRRLRFAMEVDCDARVVRNGADPNDYGLALLYVSERQSRAPLTAIALIERTSQLERRIQSMFNTPRKHRVLVAGLCLGLAGSCLYAATRLDAPRVGMAEVVLKPPPAMDQDNPGIRLGQRFEMLLQAKYPDLLAGRFAGTPIVIALVNPDGSITQSTQVSSDLPIEKIEVDEKMFDALGLSADVGPYAGAMGMQLPADASKKVLIVYTERAAPGERFVSRLFPDTRKQDRELFAQQFPDAREGVAAGQQPWLLLDRSGVVLRRGLEALPADLHQALERRYGGIGTREVTVTPLTNDAGEPLLDSAGHEVHLHAVWLAPGSPAPQN
jgi:beta-lactamase regulating signal transducer with metallopeptidase domain